MAEDKTVSKESYVWGHFGVIVFHTLIASLLIYLSYAKVAEKGNTLTMRRYRNILFTTGIVLLIVSLGSLAPIFSDYDKLENVVINKN